MASTICAPKHLTSSSLRSAGSERTPHCASGSLGHGLPIAVGIAQALGMSGDGAARVFVLVGYAELEEGANHDAKIVMGDEDIEVYLVIDLVRFVEVE